MPRSRCSRCSRHAALLLIGLLGALAPASHPARAAVLYHSPADDGVPGDHVDAGGPGLVYLYLDGGPIASAVGRACVDGLGDEVCGLDVTLTGLGGLTLTGFVADAGADVLVNLEPGSLRLNLLDGVSPSPGPKRLGRLQVTTPTGGALELSQGEAIGADLGSELLTPSNVVTVPEPGLLLGLAVGLPTASALARRRRRAR